MGNKLRSQTARDRPGASSAEIARDRSGASNAEPGTGIAASPSTALADDRGEAGDGPTGRSDVLAFVGANLRRLRARAGLSQVGLAAASGISRRMIVSLEGGDTNISLTSLDRLAEALGATFIELVSDPAAQRQRLDTVAWRGSSAQSLGVLLGSVPARAEAQLWSWSLGPGDRYEASPDPEGWHEMIFVSEGLLVVELADGPVTVAAGDYVIFSSAQAYAYRNAADGTTRFIRHVVL